MENHPNEARTMTEADHDISLLKLGRNTSDQTIALPVPSQPSRETVRWQPAVSSELRKLTTSLHEVLAELDSQHHDQDVLEMQNSACNVVVELHSLLKLPSVDVITQSGNCACESSNHVVSSSSNRLVDMEKQVTKVLMFQDLLEDENKALHTRCAHLESELQTTLNHATKREEECASLQQTVIRLQWQIRDCEASMKKLLRTQLRLVDELTEYQKRFPNVPGPGVEHAVESKNQQHHRRTSSMVAILKNVATTVDSFLSLEPRTPLHLGMILQILLSFVGFITLTFYMETRG